MDNIYLEEDGHIIVLRGLPVLFFCFKVILFILSEIKYMWNKDLINILMNGVDIIEMKD